MTMISREDREQIELTLEDEFTLDRVMMDHWRSLQRQLDQLEQRLRYLENLLRFHEHDGK